MLALYRCGRQAEALRASTVVRDRLHTELGVEPGPALRALEAEVLEQRAELDWSAPPANAPPDVRPPSGHGAGGAHGYHRSGSSRPAPPATPKIHYARTDGGINLAYQVVGDGPLDLLIVPGYVSHLDTWWEARSGRLVAGWRRSPG